MKYLVFSLLIIFSIGFFIQEGFAEIQYDEQQHFRIDLPNNWTSMDNSPSYSGFLSSEGVESVFPIVISYGLDDDLIGGIGSASWEFDSVCDPIFTGTTSSSVSGLIDGANRPRLYEYNLNCVDEPIIELEEWDENGIHFKKNIEYPIWKNKYDQKINESKEITMHITNGVEFWNIAYGYNLKMLNKIPDLDDQLTAIIDSFEPVTCSENVLTEIILTGERNPILKNRYQYDVTVNNPTELGIIYVVMGQNAHTYNIENRANVDNSDHGYLRGGGNGDSVTFEIAYRNLSYNEGESYIKITNGCFQELFPITIWENEPIIQEERKDVEKIKMIPSWIKNNAGWWADGSIDDTAFIQGLQFLIKEKIINVESKSQSSSEAKEIPSWIKNNAGWWADGSIDEGSFVTGIEYLVKEGIISVD